MHATPSATWTRNAWQLGRHIHVYDALDSTNTLALALANDPARHGLVLLAREQTAGRGQYGRVWQAPAGSSVLLSLLLFPPESLRRPVLLTAWAAVAVAETVQQLAGLAATIKWPNDVLVNGKKVCGILIEQRTTGHADFPLASVVGIGLNVAQSAEFFAQANLPDAASLASLAGRALTFEDAAMALVEQLDGWYQRLLDGDLATLEAIWKRRLGLIGKPVLLETAQQTQPGELLDASFAGVDFREATGHVVRLPPEAIKHIHRATPSK
jgi:BirA family biotin operon repressor/biotin-[acetyl-CoA-carboxylase] ligase